MRSKQLTENNIFFVIILVEIGGGALSNNIPQRPLPVAFGYAAFLEPLSSDDETIIKTAV